MNKSFVALLCACNTCVCVCVVYLLPQKLCLHDNHLVRFRLASSLRQLTKLLLSFNELTSAEDIQHLVSLIPRPLYL